MSSDSRTEKYEISFQDLKIWVRFSGLKFWGRDLEKFQGKSGKKFKVLKLSKIIPKCPNVFWGNLFEIFFCPVFHGVIESFRKKIKENSKVRKSTELFPKLSKLVLNMFCGIFCERKIAPCSMEGRVFWKISKKIKKFSKFQKWPKSFSKVSKRVLNMLWGDFCELFCRVFHAGLFRFSRLKNMRSVFWT